jgi:polynucleotide 5'-kinase involved in rRNA processing
MIGPPFTHLQTPAKAYFIGSNTPKQNPDYYMNCLLELFSEYMKNYKNKMPLIINTQGWVKGKF